MPAGARRRGTRAPAEWQVEIYDLVKQLDPENPDTIESVRHDVMIKKREFVSHAQSAVEPGRRLSFFK